MNMPFDPYEQQVISEIAKNETSPSPVQAALEFAGKPIAKVLEAANKSENKIMKKVTGSIHTTVEKSIKATIKGANQLTGDDAVRKEYWKKFRRRIGAIEEIRALSLRDMDTVADTFSASNGFFVATEGAVMGAATSLLEAVPLAQVAIPAVVAADVAASMTLMSRHICQISTSYGYPSADIANIPHILSAMMPTSTSFDEAFLAVKAAAIGEIRAASQYLIKEAAKKQAELAAKEAGRRLAKEMSKEVSACPQLIKLIQYVTQRLGITITEKELGMLVPIAGAVLNGGLNLAFQQMNHTNSKDYFRKLYLVNKYGAEPVFEAIRLEIEKRKSAAS